MNQPNQFQQYVINKSQMPQSNSRNTVHKSGIGARLNTKNNNMSLANRQNTQSSFSNNMQTKSPGKPVANTIFINNMQPSSNKGSFSQQSG